MKKYKKGGKKFPDLTGDGKVTFADVLKGRGVKKAGKGMKYENGGRKTGDPKKKKYPTLVDSKSKKFPAIAKAEAEIRKMRESDKSTRGKAALSSRDASRSQAAVEGGYSTRKNNDDGRRLAPRTLTPKGPLNKGSRFDTAKERKDPNFRKQRYTVANESKEKKLKVKKAGKGMKYMKGGKYDPKKAAMMKGLEAKIKKAKGTPEAKPLVEKYRKLTGTK